MAPLKFCANISWLFTELPDFSQRMYAAASAGFRAVEAAWLYDSDLQDLQRAREATGVEVILINSPPGNCNPTQRPDRAQKRRRNNNFRINVLQEISNEVIWVLVQFLEERQSSDKVWMWL